MDSFDYVKNWFERFGYKVLEKPAIQENDCDMHVIGKKKSLRVEVKAIRELSNGSWQAQSITTEQKKYDAVAVVFPCGQVLVEKMDDYLKSCSPEGYRTFTWLKL